MADTTYNVRLNFTPQGLEGTITKTDALANTFDKLSKAVAGAFAVHKILDFGSRLVKLNSDMERMQISLAATLTGFGAPGFAQGGKDFEKAMSASALLMDRIRLASAEVSANADDMTMIFQALMPGGIKAGKSMMGGPESVFEMAKLFSALPGINARLAKGGAPVIARELQMLMEGNARGNLDIYGPMREFLGAPKEFNKLTEPERWERLSKAIHTLITPEHLDRVSKSWGAISTTTLTWAQQLFRVATGSAFETLKTHLREVNTWFIKNRESVEEWARTIGQNVGEMAKTAFDSMVSAVKYIIENKDTILEVLKTMAVAFGAYKTANFAMDLASSATTLATKFNALAMVVAAVAAGLQWVLDLINEKHDKDVKDKAPERNAVERFLKMSRSSDDNAGAFGVGENLIRFNHLANKNGVVYPTEIASFLNNINYDTVADHQYTPDDPIVKELYRNLTAVANQMKVYDMAVPKKDKMADPMEEVLKQTNKPQNTPRKPDVKVDVVIKQDISMAEDPDRILHRTKQALNEALISPIESVFNRTTILR